MTSRPSAAHAHHAPLRARREDPAVLLQKLWRDVDVARRAIARGRAIAIAHTARGVLTGLTSVRVRVELAHAAAGFAEARDDRPGAEEWVRFAIAARATLERAKGSGAPSLAEELDELDEELEDAREAVLLLAPEDYREALAGTPPRTRAWWGERARLDAGLREIDLERALGSLAGQ
jgi:hypothetical protein